MALQILETNVVLDLYDHDGTRPQIKSIALDDNTRYVFARLTYKGQAYDIGSDATVKLIIIRPDKVGAQVIGETREYENYNEDETVSNVYGAYAELDQPAIAVAGILLGQFIITSGDQILRSQIFSVNNGQALDSDTWAGDYNGYNLDELVEKVDDAVAKVDGMKADVDAINDGLAVEMDTPITLWAQGSIISADGTNNSSKYRCRSLGYIGSTELEGASIKIADGYKITARIWDTSMAYVGMYPQDWVEDELAIPVQSGYSYRIVIAKTDETMLAPSDIPSNAVRIVSHTYSDDTLTMSGKAADAKTVGDNFRPFTATTNTSSTILAAKYFSYKDGTAPVIDWYLLADKIGNLYISKDLKTRRYIIRLPNWYNYKFAVRQNGDIIAVNRTDELSGGQTYDATLDDNRRNPLVCLYADGYKMWYEVDFGDNKKPCGWLENCGVEVLPNGDIIFGEYTRMMVVYTANLWRIKAGADITNSASWEILKTYRVAKDDTEEYDESVIEHFHTVQVDPFTGTVYYATGDAGQKSQIWYSTDGGDTWIQQNWIDPDSSQTVTSGEKLFRLLNFNFTEGAVYWSSDSSLAHAILKAERNGASGFKPDSVEVLAEIPTSSTRPATYGSVYYHDLGIMVLMERCDYTATEMLFRAYDLVDQSLKTICTIKSADGTARNVGFRTEYTEFEPLDGVIKVGFGSTFRFINRNAICGNVGGTFAQNVNNLSIRISMDADRNIYAKFGTYYI